MIWTTSDIITVGLYLVFVLFCCAFRMGIFAFIALMFALILTVRADDLIWRSVFIAMGALAGFLAFMRKELED